MPVYIISQARIDTVRDIDMISKTSMINILLRITIIALRDHTGLGVLRVGTQQRGECDISPNNCSWPRT